MAVIDADSHLFERPDVWRTYADPSRRHLALSIETDEHGHSFLVHGGRRLFAVALTEPGNFPGMGVPLREAREGTPSSQDYAADMPDEYWNGAARAKVMESWGIEEGICFPHWGLNWEQSLEDDLLAARTNMEAWNRWAIEVRADSANRVHPVGHVSMRGELDWLDQQLSTLAAGGIRVALLARGLVDGVRPSHPDLDRAWAMFVDHGVSPVFHVGSTAGMMIGRAWTENDPWPAMPLLPLVLMGMDMKLLLADLTLNGVLARHPRLRLGVMELGVKWVPEVVNGLDGTLRAYTELTGGPLTKLDRLPSEYIKSQVTFGAFAHEAAQFVDQVGEVLMFSGDFPHPEGLADSFEQYRTMVGPLAPEREASLYGGNAALLIRPDGA